MLGGPETTLWVWISNSHCTMAFPLDDCSASSLNDYLWKHLTLHREPFILVSIHDLCKVYFDCELSGLGMFCCICAAYLAYKVTLNFLPYKALVRITKAMYVKCFEQLRTISMLSIFCLTLSSLMREIKD